MFYLKRDNKILNQKRTQRDNFIHIDKLVEKMLVISDIEDMFQNER